MINTQQLGISLLILVIVSCQADKKDISFKYVTLNKKENTRPYYKDYCLLTKNVLSEKNINAREYSFFGDHKNAEKAQQKIVRKRDKKGETNLKIEGVKDQEALKKKLLKILSTKDSTSKEYQSALQILPFIKRDKDVSVVFKNATSKDALTTIVEQSHNYHYTLINEAHHSGQHRSFTTSLLKPLWGLGYRYLALEALGYDAPDINTLEYPLINSGYFIQETSFGNMIREAKKIGYKLVTYESKIYDDQLTERDKEQAINIYNQTLKKDKTGKVLIHAGFGHIAEIGDARYQPMGLQLKKIIGEDILTIDQEAMTGTMASERYDYISYVKENFALNNPLVIKDEKGEFLLDPVNASGMDMQVYHPKTSYQNGRPNWMITDTHKLYLLPQDIIKFQGHLIEATPIREGDDAVPVDRFIIDQETNAVILPKGEFIMKIFDCQGQLVAKYEVKVNK